LEIAGGGRLDGGVWAKLGFRVRYGYYANRGTQPGSDC
jgi:hypothetical protein